MPQPFSKTLQVMVVLCFALTCVGCSSTTNGNSTTVATSTVPTATTKAAQATPPASLKDYCAVVSPAEIQANINKPATLAFPPVASAKGNQATVFCGFGTSLQAPPVIEISFYQPLQGDVAGPFASFKTSFVSTTPIPNLGDEAYVGIPPPSKDPETDIPIAVVVRQGNYFFYVGQFLDNNSATVVPADEQVAQLYLSRL